MGNDPQAGLDHEFLHCCQGALWIFPLQKFLKGSLRLQAGGPAGSNLFLLPKHSRAQKALLDTVSPTGCVDMEGSRRTVLSENISRLQCSKSDWAKAEAESVPTAG